MMPRWKQLINARKPHLFVNGKSLCSKYLYLGQDYDSDWDGHVQSGDCKACVDSAKKNYPATASKEDNT